MGKVGPSRVLVGVGAIVLFAASTTIASSGSGHRSGNSGQRSHSARGGHSGSHHSGSKGNSSGTHHQSASSGQHSGQSKSGGKGEKARGGSLLGVGTAPPGLGITSPCPLGDATGATGCYDTNVPQPVDGGSGATATQPAEKGK
jgi:hypothetical protein